MGGVVGLFVRKKREKAARGSKGCLNESLPGARFCRKKAEFEGVKIYNTL